eukprot:TRINITY_DN5378_c0_g1_i1.p1 TRINITY_DN5378_c0_g1~~TRINITY_DN5378_c0_g1_i1.p1  ORF type:complete len:722 (+),score=113.61 TRINITY_DN5378_c0_g1_i1:80-2245(+)
MARQTSGSSSECVDGLLEGIDKTVRACVRDELQKFSRDRELTPLVDPGSGSVSNDFVQELALALSEPLATDLHRRFQALQPRVLTSEVTPVTPVAAIPSTVSTPGGAPARLSLFSSPRGPSRPGEPNASHRLSAVSRGGAAATLPLPSCIEDEAEAARETRDVVQELTVKQIAADSPKNDVRNEERPSILSEQFDSIAPLYDVHNQYATEDLRRDMDTGFSFVHSASSFTSLNSSGVKQRRRSHKISKRPFGITVNTEMLSFIHPRKGDVHFRSPRSRRAASGSIGSNKTPTERVGRELRWSGVIDSFEGLSNKFVGVSQDPRFDYVSGVLIIIYSLMIGVETQYMASTKAIDIPVTFRVFDIFFLVVFTVELMLRWYSAGIIKYFRGSNAVSNMTDLALVVLHMTEEGMALVLVSQSTESGFNFGFLRVLRILRLARIVRLVRVLVLFKELRVLVCSVANSLRSLMWTVVLLLLMLYVIGVYFTQLVTSYVAEISESTDAVVLIERFGTLPISCLSLFQAMTGGVDWHDLVVPLQSIHPMMAVILALYIAFAVLALTNVITGVFVESALQSTAKDREADLVSIIYDTFTSMDKNGEGSISWATFEKFKDEPRMVNYFRAVDLDQSEARSLFDLLDIDGSGCLTAEEFVIGCLRLRGPARAIDLATVLTLTYQIDNMCGKTNDELAKLRQEIALLPISTRSCSNVTSTRSTMLQGLQGLPC